MVNISLTQSDWIIIGGLCIAIVALAYYISQLHKIHSREQKENLINMTKAMLDHSTSVQNNTEVMKEMKTLLHEINTRQIKNDAKNGN